MSRDYSGNTQSNFVTLGANNHSENIRADMDYYCTHPDSLKIFLKALERDNIKLHDNIWECACGERTPK